MAHRLVFSEDQNGKLGQARMVYRTREGIGVPWHAAGYKFDSTITISDLHEKLGTSSLVELQHIYFGTNNPNTSIGIADPSEHLAVVWEGRFLNKATPDTKILQNKDFVDSFQSWIDAGFEIETAGLLRDGAVIWVTVRLADGLSDDFKVRKDDHIAQFFTAAHAHDGTMSIKGGLNDVRVVCNNTLTQSFREGTWMSRRHSGDVKQKIGEIHTEAQKYLNQGKQKVEIYRFLDSKAVANEETVLKFIQGINGKSCEELPENFKKTARHEEIIERFETGIGNEGRTFWDLFNAVTELNTHSLGNEMKGEKFFDRVARRMDGVMFGALAEKNLKALDVAVKMAQMAA